MVTRLPSSMIPSGAVAFSCSPIATVPAFGVVTDVSIGSAGVAPSASRSVVTVSSGADVRRYGVACESDS